MATFDQLVTDVKEQINQTSSEATTRVGRRINDRYKRITSALGIQQPRRTTVQTAATIGVQTLVFTGIEKLYNVQDRSTGSYRLIEEVSVDEIREISEFNDSQCNMYAVLNTTATTVTILMDCVPSTGFTLYADGMANASTLAGSNVPAFAESFHDILFYGALADEYRKAMRKDLADDAERMYEKRLAELRMSTAASAYRDIYQGKRTSASLGMASGGSGGSGSSLTASSSWTQTGLITFDRSSATPDVPFAVVAGADMVANLDADKLDGLEATAFHKLSVASAGSLLFVDATHDIGASGATRPRDLFLSRNAVVGGTLGVTGISTLQAALLFSADATHDIGAAGATRPRDFHLSRNALMGGTLGVTGVLTATAQAVFTNALKTGAAIAYINDDANAQMTTGITVNQGAADNEIVSLKSSDVAHGMTGRTETDTFGTLRKSGAATGGLLITGHTSGQIGIQIGAEVTTESTTKSINGFGAILLRAQLKNGTSVTAISANNNLLSLDNDGTTRFILDADGDSHQDVGTAWTNFDDDDDIKRMDAVAVALARENDPLREAFVKDFEGRRAIIEAMPGKKLVEFNEDGHHFVNMSRLSMLHHGAIRQIARELESTKGELRERINHLERLLTSHRGEGSAELPA